MVKGDWYGEIMVKEEKALKTLSKLGGLEISPRPTLIMRKREINRLRLIQATGDERAADKHRSGVADRA